MPDIFMHDVRPLEQQPNKEQKDDVTSVRQTIAKPNVVGRSEQFYCVSSNALVYGNPCEKWCGDENCKAICKQ